MKTHSAAHTFYNMKQIKTSKCQSLLNNRVKLICEKLDINLFKILFFQCDNYLYKIKRKLTEKLPYGTNGTVDSIRHLVRNRTTTNAGLLKFLLHAF